MKEAGTSSGAVILEPESPAPADVEPAAPPGADPDWESEPSLPGATAFEARRGHVLARAKGEPVVFIRTPEYDEDVPDAVRVYRSRINSTSHPWDVLLQLLPHFAESPADGRRTLLREGYLYASDPDLAYSLVSLVRPHHLFQSERIWVQRGSATFGAVRRNGTYVYADGPEEGQPVRLLFLDRVGDGDAPDAPPLHRDLRALKHELGFDRARIRHITTDRVVADLRYAGSVWVETVLRSDGARLSVERESGGEPNAGPAQRLALFRARSLEPVLEAIQLNIAERLPFDEPRNEIGQEDGKLRGSWQWAYLEGRERFRLRRDEYSVFDAVGRPRVPQVCVDFLVDSLERASGAWWRVRGETPGKTPGRLDLERFLPRDMLRRAHAFIEFARSRPEWFSVHEFPEAERIPLGQKRRFFDYVVSHAQEFEPGDMIFIRGFTPWDKSTQHAHSFFVYETDPVTGVPIAIAGNPGSASLWSWESEARRTPERTLRYRIRPTLALLELISGLAAGNVGRTPVPVRVPSLLAMD